MRPSAEGALDALLAAPPQGLVVEGGLDRLILRHRAPVTLRDHLLEWIGILLMMSLPLGVATLFTAPLAPLFRGSVLVLALGMLLGLVTVVLGLLVGLAAAAGVTSLAQRVLRVEDSVTITLSEHALWLERRQIPLVDVLFIDGDDEVPEVVLRGGDRLPLGAGARPLERRWLAAVLRAVLARRTPAGSAADIPRELTGLQHRPQSPAKIR